MNLRPLPAGELQRVADQILIELGEQPRVGPLFRQRVAFDLGAGPLNGDLQSVNRVAGAGLQRNEISFQVRPSRARKLEKIVDQFLHAARGLFDEMQVARRLLGILQVAPQ